MSQAVIKAIQKNIFYGLPIVFSQLIRILIPVGSTIMVARLGVDELAANSLVSSYFLVSCLFGIGVMFSVTMVAGGHYGAGDIDRAGASLSQGFWLGVFIAIAAAILYIIAPPVLRLLGQDPKIVALTPGYFYFIAIGMIFYFFSLAIQQFLIAIGKPKILYLFAVIGTITALILNWLFILKAGLGLTGMGVGFVLSSFIVFFISICYVHFSKKTRAFPVLKSLLPVNLQSVKQLFMLGWPIGLNMVVEIGVILILVLMIGWVSEFALAAYQVVWQLVLLAVMIPFGLSQAATAVVSQYLGAKDWQNMRVFCFTGITMSVLLMLIVSVLYIIFHRFFIGIFLDPNIKHVALVRHIAKEMLYVTAFYQVFDGLRIVAVGALRGLKDVHVPLMITFFSFWCVGLPVAAILGFSLHMGAIGMWLGLGVSVLICAVLLFVRLVKRLSSCE